MAYIRYRPEQELDAHDRVPDPDNIIQIHAVSPAVIRHHYDLYRTVMHGPGPLSRRERWWPVSSRQPPGWTRCRCANVRLWHTPTC